MAVILGLATALWFILFMIAFITFVSHWWELDDDEGMNRYRKAYSRRQYEKAKKALGLASVAPLLLPLLVIRAIGWGFREMRQFDPFKEEEENDATSGD